MTAFHWAIAFVDFEKFMRILTWARLKRVEHALKWLK